MMVAVMVLWAARPKAAAPLKRSFFATEYRPKAAAPLRRSFFTAGGGYNSPVARLLEGLSRTNGLNGERHHRTVAAEAEQRLLSRVTSLRAVDAWIKVPELLRGDWAPQRISTVEIPGSTDATPVVLAHGFGAGKGVFAHNFEALSLSGTRRVLAFDWLGMGLSDRPLDKFPRRATPFEDSVRGASLSQQSGNDSVPDAAVEWFVLSMERWREAVMPEGEQFDLVAHSIGGYLAAHYARRYPQYVRRLVLISPCGLPAAPGEGTSGDGALALNALRATPWHRVLTHLWRWNITPQTLLRALGKQFEASVLRKVERRYTSALCGDVGELARYIYSINALPPSSELCLNALFYPVNRPDGLRGVYARKPLAGEMDFEVGCPTTVLYGDNDWMLNDLVPPALLRFNGGKAKLEIIKDAGHQIHVENPPAFNRAVLAALA